MLHRNETITHSRYGPAMKSPSPQVTFAIALSLALTGLFAVSTGAPRRDGAELQIPAFATAPHGPLANIAR
ncbi:hypothetical protein MTsN3n11_09670 [Qipengyuania sp. MTN3-11]